MAEGHDGLRLSWRGGRFYVLYNVSILRSALVIEEGLRQEEEKSSGKIFCKPRGVGKRLPLCTEPLQRQS
jgi:hypothetical protein